MSSWPVFDDEQISAVSAALRSGKVNAWTGPDVRAFEAEYADHVGVAKAIALANGSVSLELALRALKLQPGDEVIVSPRSFVASASCVVLMGGRPVFADVDRDTQNITPATIAPLINERTRGIIPVHLGGWPCAMPEMLELAAQHDLWVIEDCAQAHGAAIDGRPVGSFGAFGSFSFCQDKIITTGGEGGLLTVEDEDLWKTAWSFKDHGKSYDAVFNRQHPPGFRWLHEGFGTNWRMTGLSAAIGRIQLRRLPQWRETRARNAMILADAAVSLPALRTPTPANRERHAYYRFYTFVRPERLAAGWSRDRIVEEISARGFRAFSGSCSEIYLEKAYQDSGFAPAARLPVAKELGETSLAFLVDPAQSEEAMRALAACLTDVVSEAAA